MDNYAYLGQPFVTDGADGSMDYAYLGQPFVVGGFEEPIVVVPITGPQINPNDAYISGTIGSVTPRRRGLDQRSPVQEAPYKYGSGQIPGSRRYETEEDIEEHEQPVSEAQVTDYNGFAPEQIAQMQLLVKEYDDQIVMRQLIAQYEAVLRAREEDDLIALALLL